MSLLPRQSNLLTPWVIVAAALPLFGQKRETEIQAEIEFARGLASKWSFADLATEVISGLERSNPPRSMLERLSLAKCEIYSIGARNERDPGRRRTLFDDALSAYQSFIAQNPQSNQRASAEAAFVDVSAAYARALAMDQEAAVGEEVDKLKSRQKEVLEAAVKLTQALIDSIRSIPADEQGALQRRELGDLMLNRGNMLAEIGKAYGEEGGNFFFDQAISTLEEIVFEFGDGTPFALRAYDAMGTVYAYREMWTEAADFYQGVVDVAIPLKKEEWDTLAKDMAPAEKELRWLFVELATDGLVEAMMNTGRVDKACKYGLHLYNVQRREGFNFSVQGYVSLLAVARAVMESGGCVGGDLAAGEGEWFATQEEMEAKFSSRYRQAGVDFALKIADSVGQANQGNSLQVRAQKLIAEVIDRPGVVVSPDTLLEAAEGAYNERNLTGAVEGYMRVMRSLDATDDVTRRQYGARIMNRLGDCYRLLERPLEAAMAYREGCTTWSPDPAYDGKNAQAFYEMARRVRRTATAQAEVIDALITEAEVLVKNLGTASKDQVVWSTAESYKDKKNYEKAIGEYGQIESTSDYYERALVAVAYCKLNLGELDEARKLYSDYLDGYVKDPTKIPTTPARQARRKEAMAEAEFFRGFILSSQAREGDDRAQHQKVVDALGSYADTYPDQARLAPQALYYLMLSQIALGDEPGATKSIERMVSDYPDAKATATASVSFYKTLEAKLAEAKDEAQKTAILRQMAVHLERANASGGVPNFAYLRNESLHWQALGEWAKAEKALRRLIDGFGGDKERAEDLRRLVRPDLGQCLLMQRRVAEAKEVLAPLVTDESSRPSKTTMLLYAMSVAGWLEGKGADIQVVVGAGGDDTEYELIATKLSAISNSLEDKYGCERWATEFQMIYSFYVQGQQNTKALAKAKDILSRWETVNGDPDWKLIDERCSDATIEASLREAYGNQTLRQRFLWLKSKLR